VSEPVDRLNEAFAGRYSIEREIGHGGMSTVYLAEDLKHHRRVAIKVLRDELTSVLGADRFLREIEIAANLNHPHVLPLFDSGRTEGADGFLYYVMPFAEGETLGDRLAREGELPIGVTVRILRDVVDALAAAHRQGVIHRDVKPDNVMLLGKHAVVADFGIAKAVSDAAGQNTLTTMGVALGTPAYMAPEQAAGDPHVDHRADIYAVGVMAYEMLTGRTPFQATTPQAILAAHVTQTPERVGERRESVPPLLADAVMRCLEKKPADRWQSADDLLLQLEGMPMSSGGMTPTTAVPAAAVPFRKRPAAWMGVAAAVLVLAAGAWWASHRPPPSFVFGRSELVTGQPGLEIHPAISPDGRFVAYAAGGSAHMRIYIRSVGGGRTIPLSDDTTDIEFQPRWSPDGSELLYLTHGGVWVSSALGGAGRPVVAPSSVNGVSAAAWSPDGGEIAFVRGDTLLAAPSGGGSARLLAVTHQPHACRWSPNGRWVACASGNRESTVPGSSFGNLAPSRIVLVPAAGGSPIPITEAESLNESPVWSPDGHELFFVSSRDGPRDVYVQEISSNGHARGLPSRMTTGLGAQSLSISSDGTRFAYDVYTARSNIWTLPIPGHGAVDAEEATQLTTGNQVIESMRPSPDGKWLLYDSDLRGNADIYRIPIAGGTPERLTSEPFDEFAPSLSPDGRLLAYHSFRTSTRDVEVKALDGSPAVRVTDTPAQESYPLWSPDGKKLLIWDQSQARGILVVTRLGPDSWSSPDTIAKGDRPRWSPDGREIAFLGVDSTGAEPVGAVYVVSVASRAVREIYANRSRRGEARMSLDGLEWAPDGRMYVKTHDALGRATISQVEDDGTLRPMVRFPDLDRPSNRADFAVDRKRFYFTFEDRESDVYVADVTRR